MSIFKQTVVQPALDQLETLVVGREVLAFDALPSTNTTLREQALRGVAEGLVAIADEQTAGRGRRGRAWTAPPGSSLLMSILAGAGRRLFTDDAGGGGGGRGAGINHRAES